MRRLTLKNLLKFLFLNYELIWKSLLPFKTLWFENSLLAGLPLTERANQTRGIASRRQRFLGTCSEVRISGLLAYVAWERNPLFAAECIRGLMAIQNSGICEIISASTVVTRNELEFTGEVYVFFFLLKTSDNQDMIWPFLIVSAFCFPSPFQSHVQNWICEWKSFMYRNSFFISI